MSYSCARKTLSPQPMLAIQRRVTRAQIPAVIAEVLPRVFAFAQQNGCAPAGPPFCRYLEMGPEYLVMEPGIPIAAPAQTRPDSEIQAGTLPGGPVAVTVHLGPYDRLPEAVTALREWMERQALPYTSGFWESYVTDPGETPDPKDWKTDVFWPLAG